MTSSGRARDDALARAKAAALHALPVIDRVVAGEGGYILRLAEGELTDTAVTADGAYDLADLVPPLAEHLRHFRAVYGGLSQHQEINLPAVAPAGASLPRNRKEQYYTATVLPLIIVSDGFAHVHRFLRLCGLDVEPFLDHGREQGPGFQFFTEYNFAESLRPSDLELFPNAPTSHDTPDLLLVGSDWIVAVEAKMFHDPSPTALDTQLQGQRLIVDYLADALGVSQDRVHHVLLLPEELPSQGVSAPVVTWQSVVDAYRVVGPAYWVSVLSDALEHYDDLKSVSALRGQNNDAYLTGAQIAAQFASGEKGYAYMGRNRGLNGPELAHDIESGGWRTQRYEVRTDPREARNWFPIAEFVDRLPDSGT